MKSFCVIFLVIGLASITMAQETNATIRANFEQYDAAVVSKILDHWFKILDSLPPKTLQPAGKVVLEFRLFTDGHIGDLKVDSSTVDKSQAALCKKAIVDSVPFASWPKEMRQAYTNDFRIIHYTFYYTRDGTPPNKSLQPTATAPSALTNK